MANVMLVRVDVAIIIKWSNSFKLAAEAKFKSAIL